MAWFGFLWALVIVSTPASAQVGGDQALLRAIEKRFQQGSEQTLEDGTKYEITVRAPRNPEYEVFLRMRPAGAFRVTKVGDATRRGVPARFEVEIVNWRALAYDDGVIRRAQNVEILAMYRRIYRAKPRGRPASDCILVSEFRKSDGQLIRLDSPRHNYKIRASDESIVPIVRGDFVEYRRSRGDMRPVYITLSVDRKDIDDDRPLTTKVLARVCDVRRATWSADLGIPTAVAVGYPLSIRYVPPTKDRSVGYDMYLEGGFVLAAGIGLDIPSNPPRFPIPITLGGMLEYGSIDHRVRLVVTGGVEVTNPVLVSNLALQYRLRLPRIDGRANVKWLQEQDFRPPSNRESYREGRTLGYLFIGPMGGFRTIAGTPQPHIGVSAGISFVFQPVTLPEGHRRRDKRQAERP